MALTPAEKQRLYRQRKKQQQQVNDDLTIPYLGDDFSSFIEGRLSFFESLDAFGVELRGTRLDQGEQRFKSDGRGELTMTSIERATGLVEVMLEAATELAGYINSYKMQSLDAAAEKAMASPPKDEEQVRPLLAEVNRIHDIRRALTKRTRHDIPAIEAKGDMDAQ